MEVIYDNGMFQVKANQYDNEYLVINLLTDIVEARESAQVTAEYKADALKETTINRNKAKAALEAHQ